MKIIRSSVVIGGLALVSGGLSPLSAQDRGTVVIYRNSGAGTLKSPPIYMDGVQIAEMGNKRYLSFSLPAGVKHLWSDKKQVIDLRVEPRGKYFIVAQYPDQGGIHGFNPVPRLHLFQVTVEQGEREIQSLKPLDSKHAFNVELSRP